MATVQIIHWRNIPSLVEAKDADGTHKIQLSHRFQALIDDVAMNTGLAGTDAYLEEWGKGDVSERDGGAEEAAKAVAEDLEGRFKSIRDAAQNAS